MLEKLGFQQLIEETLTIQRQTRATPVVGDVAEHAVLDLVPLAGTGREVADLNGKLQLVGKLLQMQPPSASADTR